MDSVLAFSENFLEVIAGLIARVLTNDETEAIIRGFHNLNERIRRISSENLRKLREESETKRPFCKHKGRCSQNCFRGFLRTFAAAYVVKFLVGLLPLLLRSGIKNRAEYIWKIAGRDTLRFSLFMALFNSIYKGVLCLLRRLRGTDDAVNPLVAGAMAGLSIAVDSSHSRRLAIALYLTSRAFQFGVVSAAKHGWVPTIPHADVLLMGLSASQIINAFLFSPDSLSPSYLSFLYTHGGLRARAGKQSRSLAESIRLSVEGTATPSPVPELRMVAGHTCHICSLIHPADLSCTVGAVRFFVESLPRSMQLYGPLNLILGGIFKHKTLLKSPHVFLYRALIGTMRSSAFLSAFCTVCWAIPCAMRNYFGKEFNFTYYLNGFLGGCCVLLEVPGRRLELAMYCFPRAAESLYNVLVDKKILYPIKNGEIGMFAAAMGILMAIYQRDPDVINDGYRSVMTRFFGVN